MVPPLLKARARLATAAVVLIAAVALLHYEIPPVPTWFYVLAWYPTLVVLDQVVVLLGGESLLARPPELAAMLWWSAVIWLLFEAINFRLQNWYYVFLPPQRLDRWAGITISLATVVPAVLLPECVLDRLGVWRQLRGRSIPLTPARLEAAGWTGWAMLALVLAFPRYLYPLTWGAVWLVVEPLLYRRDPEHSLLGDAARGEWGRIARLMAAGLFAGALWESFNGMARGRWIYTVPFLEHSKIFEMPPAGFIGFPFFALEVWSMFYLLAPRTTRRTLLGSAVFALVVLAGIDRWTVSSTSPRLADLPRVTNGVLQRLAAAGCGCGRHNGKWGPRPASAIVRHPRGRARGSRPGRGPGNGGGDLVEIRRAELERRGADPAVHLRCRSGADDRPGHAGPCERPRD